MNIGVLCAAEGLLDGYFVAALLARGVPIRAIIADTAPVAARDLAIHEQRTAGALPRLALDAFEAHAISIYLVTNHNNAATARILAGLDLDLAVNAGTPRILKAPVLSATRYGVLNCHPGLLPHFRGCSAVEWALHFDEPVGNTVHLMSEYIDAGPILATRAVDLRGYRSYPAVRTAVYRGGFELTADVVAQIDAHGIETAQAPAKDAGRYFKPIPADLLDQTIARLEAGEYGGARPLGTGTPLGEAASPA